jgi:hypothetical protein
MGGRKSSKVEKIVGTSDKLKSNKKDFLDAVKSENPKKIISSAVDYITKSDQAISNLAKAAKLLDFISANKNKKEAPYQERKEEVTSEWAEIKKKQDVKTSSEIDRIFIESATKVIRRGKK